ncbi:hypothetical protein MUP77_12405 [Candidatus Bathyarchaeota archaeon]|nr:hypothetical protein [Candidatus Bathyarchaeota archaeon]
MTDSKFSPRRFDSFNLPRTDIERLKKDMFYAIQKKGDLIDYTEEKADKCWNDYIDKMKKEENEKYAKQDSENAKRAKLEHDAYCQLFMETLIPVIGGISYEWTDKVKCPFDDKEEFAVIEAIGSGPYSKDRNKMKNEIVSRWLNNTLPMWVRGEARQRDSGSGKKWEINITYKLR